MKKKFETKLFQTSFLLLSIVHINAPLAAARHSPSKLGLCARLAQTFVFMVHGCFLVHEFHEFTRITKRLDNGDLIGRTNFH